MHVNEVIKEIKSGVISRRNIDEVVGEVKRFINEEYDQRITSSSTRSIMCDFYLDIIHITNLFPALKEQLIKDTRCDITKMINYFNSIKSGDTGKDLPIINHAQCINDYQVRYPD